jgi:DNA-binding response OmpR family regulator
MEPNQTPSKTAMNPTILLVDDDEAFKMLVERALNKSWVTASLQYVLDGEQAILYLSRQGRFQDETVYPFPSLVLLDLKMPRVNGFEVLQWKSKRTELRETPFVILSSSDLDGDKKRASELGARHYFMKPMDLSALDEIVARLEMLLCEHETVSTVRIFLRDSNTGQFYKGADAWVQDSNHAADFETLDRALEERKRISRSKMELLATDESGRPRIGLRLWKGD